MPAILDIELVPRGSPPTITLDRTFARTPRPTSALTAHEARARLRLTARMGPGPRQEVRVCVFPANKPTPLQLEDPPATCEATSGGTAGDGGGSEFELELPGLEVGLNQLNVAVYRRRTAWELVDTAPFQVAVFPDVPQGCWERRPVPMALVDLTAALIAGATGPADALRLALERLPNACGRWRYRANGAAFLADVNQSGQLMLDVMLAMRDPLGPSQWVAVDCQATSRLVAAIAQLVGVPATILKIMENESISGQPALGTFRVLPLGESHWQYPTVEGTLGFHDVAFAENAVWDASFRLDGSGHPFLRPHGPPVATTGVPLADFADRLVPELAARHQPNGSGWPTTFRADLEVVDPARCWIRAEGEAHEAFLDRLAAEPRGVLAPALRKLGENGPQAWAVCAPDAARTILFLQHHEADPLQVVLAWAPDPVAPGLMMPATRMRRRPTVTATRIGLVPAAAAGFTRKLQRLLEGT